VRPWNKAKKQTEGGNQQPQKKDLQKSLHSKISITPRHSLYSRQTHKMAIITGQERKIRGGPGEGLSPDAAEIAQNTIDAKRRELEERRKPKPDCEKPLQLDGFKEPVWSTSQRRWACRSKKEDKWQIWDKEKWCDFDIWEKCGTSHPDPPTNWLTHREAFATEVPSGHKKLSDRPKTFFQSVLSFFGGGK